MPTGATFSPGRQSVVEPTAGDFLIATGQADGCREVLDEDSPADGRRAGTEALGLEPVFAGFVAEALTALGAVAARARLVLLLDEPAHDAACHEPVAKVAGNGDEVGGGSELPADLALLLIHVVLWVVLVWPCSSRFLKKQQSTLNMGQWPGRLDSGETSDCGCLGKLAKAKQVHGRHVALFCLKNCFLVRKVMEPHESNGIRQYHDMQHID